MKKEKIVLVMALITIIISSIISVYAANYLYNSTEVEYDNQGKNITSTNVQGAIDELYTDANNYSSINDRVNTLESYFNNNTGTLNITGNPIKINNESLTPVKQYTLTLNGGTIYIYRIGRIATAVIAENNPVTLTSNAWINFATKPSSDFPNFQFLAIQLVNGNTLILRMYGGISIDYYFTGTSPAYLQGSGSTIVN